MNTNETQPKLVTYNGLNKQEVDELIGKTTAETIFSVKNPIKILIVEMGNGNILKIVEGDSIAKVNHTDKCLVSWGKEHFRILHGQRQTINKEILKKLAILVEKYPQQRFGQILTNYLFPDYRSHDIFFDESAETLESLDNTILNLTTHD